ncbi:hypothetical protein FRC03_002250 [Tulasnella sp. 419]|nr:hypothetical protein FRC03_002250 [Tulasnella sp. 419]
MSSFLGVHGPPLQRAPFQSPTTRGSYQAKVTGSSFCLSTTSPLPLQSNRRISYKNRKMSQGVKVYVGNLSWGTSDEHLRDLFSPYGQVVEAIVMRDRETQRSRGFGFVKLSSSEEADQAIASLNESDFDGRRIKVNLANTRPSGGYLHRHHHFA